VCSALTALYLFDVIPTDDADTPATAQARAHTTQAHGVQ
jgi:hypothetical protein